MSQATPTGIEPSDHRKAWWSGLVLTLSVAFCYRIYLSGIYWGWEEGDYGNLQITYQTWVSGFRNLEIAHLPLYYVTSACLLLFTDSVEVACRAVSLVSGIVVVAVVYALAWRVKGPAAAWTAGLLCGLQPELSLYSATPLREPFYAALSLTGLLFLTREKELRGAVAFAAAGLVRFDTYFTSIPLALFHGVMQVGRRRAALLLPGGVFALTTLIWAAYSASAGGGWLFFLEPIRINLATGVGQEAGSLFERMDSGAGLLFEFCWDVLPRKLGGILLLSSVIGAVRCGVAGKAAERTIALFFCLHGGFLCALVAVGQHEANHNLYWKWLYLWAAMVCMFGACFWVDLVRAALRGRNGFIALALTGLSMTSLVHFRTETDYQVRRSELWYRPQVEIGQWIEARFPPDATLLLDNIPAAWLNRQAHDYELIGWMDVDPRPVDSEAFCSFLQERGVSLVLWFREEWTEAPLVAPWLSDAQDHDLGGCQLLLIEADDAYGWRLYQPSWGGA